MYFDPYLVQSVMYFSFPEYKEENIFRSSKQGERKTEVRLSLVSQ